MSEWYVNGPFGIEQGFTFRRRPSGVGALTLSLNLSGRLAPHQSGQEITFNDAGHPATVLSYGDLHVVDARGRSLPAHLMLVGRRLLISIDDSQGLYPITIDPFIQQGSKLSPSSSSGSFGLAVSLSSDGNTALVGAPNDNSLAGAAFVFTRSGSTWTQQGPKLVPSDPGNAGNNNFGESVSLSADGSTALIGAPSDSPDTLAEGAAWVFTRSGSTWTQQGSRLSPSDEANGFTEFGWSVSLSADGNTALIGGPSDNSGVGAAWIYARTGTTWAEGSKLLANDESGAARFGFSVAISGDAATALIGGPHDSSNTGAAWPFVLTSGTWVQQGAKLTGSAEGASGEFGAAVALSSDGSTAMIGGASIDAAPSQSGAAWGFGRSGSTWSQQGSKIVPSGESGLGDFGLAVALSGDGGTALIGGPEDAGSVGAAWQFTRSGPTWAQQGSKFTGSGASGAASFGNGVALSSDDTTALIGGAGDSSGLGAVWPYTNSGVSVTAATGGSAVSADTTGGTFTPLTGPVLTEDAAGLIGTGTVVLNAPSGFAFDAAGSPGCGGTSGLTASVTSHTASAITCTVTVASSGSAGTLTFTGITVRPAAGTPLASGSLTETGTASLAGASGSYGTLTEAAGTASKLAFTTEPGGAVRGSAFPTAPTVTVEDQFGNTTSSSAAVALAIGAGTGASGASLSGTTSRAGPVATFTGLSIDRSGTGYVLHATASGLTAATSSTFDVAGVGALLFATEPVGAAAGAALATQPVVSVKRDDGTVETTAGTVTVAIKTGTGTAGAHLGGAIAVPTSGGTATFSGLSIDTSGAGYVLTAADSGVSVDSTPFAVTSGGGSTSSGSTSGATGSSGLVARLQAEVGVGHHLVLNSGASVVPAGDGPASYVFRLGGDGQTSVTCPGQDPAVSVLVANAVDTTASVTLTTRSGATATATTPIRIAAADLPSYSITGTSFATTGHTSAASSGPLGQVQALASECMPASGNPPAPGRSASVGNLASGDTGPTVSGATTTSCLTAVTVGIVQGIGCFTQVDADHQLPHAEAFLLCKYQHTCATIGEAASGLLFNLGGVRQSASTGVSHSAIGDLGFDAYYYSMQPVRIDGVEFDPVNGGAIVLARAGLVHTSFLQRDSAYVISSDAVVKIAGLPVSLHVPDYGALYTQTQSAATCGQNVIAGSPGCLTAAQLPNLPTFTDFAKVDGPIELAVSPEHVGIELGEFTVPQNVLPIPLVPDLPLTGTVKVNLESQQSAQVSVHVALPQVLSDGNNHGLTGDTTFTVDNQHGLDLNFLHVTVPSLAQLGLARLKNLDFTYSKATSLFDGKATLDLSDAIQGVIDAEVAFEHGDFQHAHVDYTADQGGGYPLGGGIFLDYIGADLTLDPTEVAGAANISVGPALTATGCGLFGAHGTAALSFADPISLDVKGETQILCADFGYSEDFHVDTNGDVGYGVGIDYPIPGFGSLKGSLYGQAYADLTRDVYHFQLDGNVDANFSVHVCAITCGSQSFDAGAVATWSDIGAGVCAHISVAGQGFDVGAGIDNLRQIVEQSLASGGTLTEAALLENFHVLASNCSLSGWRTLTPPPGLVIRRAARADRVNTVPDAFTVAPGTKMATIGLQGAGGAPNVLLTTPDRKQIVLNRPAGISVGSGILVDRQTSSSQTLLEIAHPTPGRWLLRAAPGSARIVKAESAESLPAPTIHAHVTGRGIRRVLHYRISRQPGLSVAFFERVGRGAREIGRADRASGSLPFTPGPGDAKRRAVVVELFRHGIPAGRLVVAQYSPGTIRPGRPAHVRVRHTRAGWRISFTPGTNSTGHLLTIHFADGGQALMATVRGRHAITVPKRVDDTSPVAIQIVGVRGTTRGPAITVKAAQTRR